VLTGEGRRFDDLADASILVQFLFVETPCNLRIVFVFTALEYTDDTFDFRRLHLAVAHLAVSKSDASLRFVGSTPLPAA
jgi:hypothetical protein